MEWMGEKIVANSDVIKHMSYTISNFKEEVESLNIEVTLDDSCILTRSASNRKEAKMYVKRLEEFLSKEGWE